MSLQERPRSNGRAISADDMTRHILAGTPEAAQPRTDPLAHATAAGVNASADRIIQAIQNQREQTLRSFKEFDAAAEAAQAMIREKADAIALQAETFIKTLTSNQRAVEELSNTVSTFGGDA